MTTSTTSPPSTFTSFLEAMSTAALDVLADFDRDAALAAGVDPTRVSAWEKLHEVYFAPASSPQKQRLAGERARRGRFSLDQLAMIERRIKHISSARTRAKLRLALLDAHGSSRLTYKALAAVAKRLVPAKQKPAQKGVSFSQSRVGMRRMSVVAAERDLADLEHALSQGLDPTKPPGPQLLANFLRSMREGGGVPHAVPRPQLLIPLPDWVKIHRGEGDEVTLGLTDGTTMTGAEFLTEHFATAENSLEAALFHPTEGAVNLYRTARLANQKQRDLARAVMTTCAAPGCRKSADACEIHHVTAWSRGGNTNIDNLATLCRYHNRVNDDDPSRPRRGRIELIDGTPVWVSPRGYIVHNNHHPYGAMQTLFGRTPARQRMRV